MTLNLWKKPMIHWQPVLLGGAVLLCIAFSAPLSEGMRQGLSLCAEAVIPSVFPSMILADVLLASRCHIERSCIGKGFSRWFRLPPAAAAAYLLGLCTGFPIGMRISAVLYKEGILTQEETMRLMAFSNNTGPAFLLAGIGTGLWSDIRIGIGLYLTQIFVSAVTGIGLSMGKQPRSGTSSSPPAPFSLTKSTRESALACVSLCGFVGFFSALSYTLTCLLPYPRICMCLLPFFEIGTAAAYIGAAGSFAPLPLICTAFAVGFSGISVHLQSAVFFADTDIHIKPYCIAKLFQGLLCGVCFPPIYALLCLF